MSNPLLDEFEDITDQIWERYDVLKPKDQEIIKNDLLNVLKKCKKLSRKHANNTIYTCNIKGCKKQIKGLYNLKTHQKYKHNVGKK